MPANDLPNDQSMLESEIAANRFGYGGSGKVEKHRDARQYLLQQLKNYDPKPGALDNAPTLAEIGETVSEYVQTIRNARDDEAARGDAPSTPEQRKINIERTKKIRKFIQKSARDYYMASVNARFDAAITSDSPFVERLVQFWSNHFAVSIDKNIVTGYAGSMEFEAIRPHVMGKFSDMLSAAETHPAMLLYLDQAQSVGPSSPAVRRRNARRARQIGLNENLAREIMELHTLGAKGGYSQTDVTEFARALTGWTVAGLARGPVSRALNIDETPGQPVYVRQIHEPGSRTILGKTYAADDTGQGQAVLNDLAVHPSTAQYIATKLARHFAGDSPPPAMVDRLGTAFMQSGGDLPIVYRAIIESPEMWVERPVKYKQPWGWLVSTYRATGAPLPENPRQIGNLLRGLGQQVWNPGSPAGYGDMASDWIGPDLLYKRAEMTNLLAARMQKGVDARTVSQSLYPATLGQKTRLAVERADSPHQALALFLLSPEFMQR